MGTTRNLLKRGILGPGFPRFTPPRPKSSIYNSWPQISYPAIAK
jgi:hypothetical protein